MFGDARLLADGLERLERALAVLERLDGDAEHADHREAAVLELRGLELEHSLGGGVGAREAEGVEVTAGVAALVGVELCWRETSGGDGSVRRRSSADDVGILDSRRRRRKRRDWKKPVTTAREGRETHRRSA